MVTWILLQGELVKGNRGYMKWLKSMDLDGLQAIAQKLVETQENGKEIENYFKQVERHELRMASIVRLGCVQRLA